MDTAGTAPPDLDRISRQEGRSPQQVVDTAVAFYLSLPDEVRRAITRLRAEPLEVQQDLVRELNRAVIAYELRRMREQTRARVERGELSALPPLSEEAAGAEAVALIKQAEAEARSARR